MNAYDTGDAAAMQGLLNHFGLEITWEQLRTAVEQRLSRFGEATPLSGALALPQAQLIIARESGFADWAALEKAHQPATSTSRRPTSGKP